MFKNTYNLRLIKMSLAVCYVFYCDLIMQSGSKSLILIKYLKKNKTIQTKINSKNKYILRNTNNTLNQYYLFFYINYNNK